MIRTTSILIPALLAVFSLLTPVSAQDPFFVKKPNKNLSAKYKSAIFRGSGNEIGADSTASFIGGGYLNTITAGTLYAVIGGGKENTAGGDYFSTVGGGRGNSASGKFATVGGGHANTASGSWSTVAGGYQLEASGNESTVGGGWQNHAAGELATVGGGERNFANNTHATVAGGHRNEATGLCATIGGGSENGATEDYATVSGGMSNRVIGLCATAVGGLENLIVFGDYATVAGGRQNEASGDYAFAAGRRAKANQIGAFVWADSQDKDYRPATPNTFNARAQNGVYFTSGAAAGADQTIYWVPGNNDWNTLSDAAAKEGFREIDPRDILRRLATLPVSEWSYIGYRQRNIGPMAQDWQKAFPSLGDDGKTINRGHLQGVSLAAIKGLVEELKERDRKIEELEARNAVFESKLQAVEERLNSLPPQ